MRATDKNTEIIAEARRLRSLLWRVRRSWGKAIADHNLVAEIDDALSSPDEQTDPPSRAWVRRMADAEAKCESVAAGRDADLLDATIAAKDRRIAELNRCVGLIRNADAYVMEPKSADAARYWDDALRLANDLYEEPPHA